MESVIPPTPEVFRDSTFPGVRRWSGMAGAPSARGAPPLMKEPQYCTIRSASARCSVFSGESSPKCLKRYWTSLTCVAPKSNVLPASLIDANGGEVRSANSYA